MHKMRAHRIIKRPAPASERGKDVFDHVLKEEIMAGSVFMRSDGQLFMYAGHTKQLYALPIKAPSEEVSAYLWGLYGIPQAENLGRSVYSHLRNHGCNQAIAIELRRFAAYDKTTLTAYVSAYDGEMWQLDGGQPHRVDNGTDNVFFADDDKATPCAVEIQPHGILIDRLIDSMNYGPGLGGITPEQQRMAMIVWLFSLAFPDLFKNKPLLMVEGTQGSGKSVSLQLIQIALLGETRPMNLGRNDERDFPIMLLRSPLAIFDNTDNYYEWIPDSICSYTTGAGWRKRKLFSDVGEVDIRPQAFIAIASKNPASFRREDTVDRQIIIRLDRLTAFTPPNVLSEEIKALRPKLLGEYLWYINQIVAELRIYNDAEVMNETVRMADFAAFARVVGRVMRWQPDTVNELLGAIRAEQEAFTAEDDPLLGLLHDWIKSPTRSFGSNIGRRLRLLTLFSEVESHAKAQEIKFFSSPRQLAQKLRSPHITREFTIEVTIENRERIYQLWRKTDPKLTALDGGLAYPIANVDEE